MERLESGLESSFRVQLNTWAVLNGISVTYVKFTGAKGWPDRMVIWGEPGSPRIIWIEWKRPGEKPRPLQLHIHQLLRSMGHDVRVYDDYKLALDEIKAAVGAPL